MAPLGDAYVDGAYIASVHRKFGTVPMRTFPNMPLLSFLKWISVKGIRKIRPLWYLPYSKEEARKQLADEFGWQYYGGHHLENRMTAFHHSYYNPLKFGIDNRNNSLSASVRSGMMTREAALDEYSSSPHLEAGLLTYFKKRLDLTETEFDRIMNLPPKSYRDYRTYKRTFERMRPFFWLMTKMNLVPESFYVKFTSRSEI